MAGRFTVEMVVTTADFHVIAYAYEFERKSRSDEPALMSSSNLDAKRHLQRRLQRAIQGSALLALTDFCLLTSVFCIHYSFPP